MSVGELEAGARQWEEPYDPGQVTPPPTSHFYGLSLKLKPARPNRKAETGLMTLDETKQEEGRVSSSESLLAWLRCCHFLGLRIILWGACVTHRPS